jgi:hypothetical protein
MKDFRALVDKLSSEKRRFAARAVEIARRMRLGDHFLVLFIPYDKHGDGDAVAAIGRGVHGRIARPPASVWLSARCAGITDAAKSAGLSAPPVRVVLFAHPNAAENGFLINPAAGGLDTLSTSWWEVPNHEYEFLYANVCNGAAVLEREPWSAVFPRWISYNQQIVAFMGTKRAATLWVELGQRLVRGCWESENVEALHHRIQAAYQETLGHLHDTLDEPGGDAITMTYMTRALNSLEMRSSQ